VILSITSLYFYKFYLGDVLSINSNEIKRLIQVNRANYI